MFKYLTSAGFFLALACGVALGQSTAKWIETELNSSVSLNTPPPHLAVIRPESHMPLNWNFPAKIGPKTGKQVTEAFVAQNPDCVPPNHPAQIRLKSGSSRPTQ
jgi:hypothetical protein